MDQLRNHPFRERVVAEMHLRRLPPIVAPAVLHQLVTIVDPTEREDERAIRVAMPGVLEAARIVRPRHAEGLAGDGVHYCWERHSEASTATVIVSGGATSPPDVDALGWLLAAPGLAIRAVRVHVVATEREAETLAPALAFDEHELVSCRVGAARIWSDFTLHADGFGVLLVAAGDTHPSDLGRLIQSLQELGNYRNLALLGLPIAQDFAPTLEAVERELAGIAGDLGTGPDDRLLDALCHLAARVAAITAAASFRMSATAAYAAIALQRLESLGCRPIAGYQSLDQFTERRLRPGVNTCVSFMSRLETASLRIERSTSLLRTRVDLAVQQQNIALLASVDRNAVRQLQLQEVVEGLSVIAISYYAFNLLDHVAGPVLVRFGLAADLVSAILVVPVCLCAYFGIRHRRRRAAPAPGTGETAAVAP